jgi:hypothetical protein
MFKKNVAPRYYHERMTMTDNTNMFCPESISRPGAMFIITSLLLYRISAHDLILIPNISMFRVW